MSSSQIPDKIMSLLTALLARAEHPNTPEPEAKMCMEQAQRLMLKHSISDAKANATQQQKSKIGAWDITLNGSYLKHRATLLNVVGSVFSCRVITYTRGRTVDHFELIGREGDLAMVFTLFEHLLRQLDHNLATLAGRSLDYKKSYILNFSGVISARLTALYDEEIAADDDSTGTAMVLLNIKSEVDRHIEQEFDDLKTGPQLANRSYAGMIDGQKDADKADIFLPGARFGAGDSSKRDAINA